MLYRKYDVEKRSCFVISSDEFENLKIFEKDIERIKIMLNQKYESEILDSPPYHFIITKAGVFPLKPTDLAHNDNSFLEAFNDDIRFLLVGDSSLLSHMKYEIASAISDVSSKYSMKISESIYYVSSNIKNTNDSITELERLSISLRDKNNKIMSVCESVIDNQITLNKNIIMLSNRNNISKLKMYSDKYSVPLSVLVELNPHVSINALKVTDTIFIPATIAAVGKIIALYCNKQSKFIHGKCRYLANKEAKVDG